MARRTDDPRRRLRGVVVLALCATGCGLTVTSERPTFDQLDEPEKSAVQIILDELHRFNKQVKQRTRFDIDEAIDQERIHVSFKGLIFAANFGDGAIHVSTWENLSEPQQALVQQWFGSASLEDARKSYQRFFYRFLGVSQGVKQYMYEVLGAGWIFGNRSVFNVERDSIRTAVSHYRETGRRAEMWGFLDKTCRPVLDQYGELYGENFNKHYLRDNFQDLANPDAPTGYIYFICRWYKLALEDTVNLTVELDWLRDLPQLED